MTTVTDSVALDAAGVAESVARAVKVKLPTWVGVPASWPSAVRISPGGRSPPATDHVIAPVPPCAASDALTGRSVTPLIGCGGVRTSGGAVTSSVKSCVAAVPTPLSAVMVNVKRPAVLAGMVPESTPVDGSIDSHDGAPASENFAAGAPSAITPKRTLPAASGTV